MQRRKRFISYERAAATVKSHCQLNGIRLQDLAEEIHIPLSHLSVLLNPKQRQKVKDYAERIMGGAQ